MSNSVCRKNFRNLFRYENIILMTKSVLNASIVVLALPHSARRLICVLRYVSFSLFFLLLLLLLCLKQRLEQLKQRIV